MWKKVMISGLFIWLLICVTDIITAFTIHHPIFTFLGQGGCYQPYYGLGYSITFYDGMTPTGLYIDTHPTINLWIYLVLNALAILFLIFHKRIFKQRKV